jgi:hypothetical protein
MTWRSLGLVTLKKLQFQYPSRRQKLWILNMFGSERSTEMVIIPQSEFSDTSLHLENYIIVFHYPLSYIACYPGINLFCIFDRWTWRQYTEPWVYMVYIINCCLTIINTQLRSKRWKQNYPQPLRNSAWALRSLYFPKAWCLCSGVQ